MSARVMNALGATELERTICATAGMRRHADARTASRPRSIPRSGTHARHLLVWGWNPMSTAPHLWRKLLDARAAGARLVVVDPFRSRTARVADEHLSPLPGTDAALAIGMMRAVVDAGLQDEDWCRAHAEGYDELLAALARAPGRALRRDLRRATPTTIASAWAASSPPPSRRCCASGWARSATWARPPPTRTIASLPALTGAWRDRGGGCSYIPLATAAAVDSLRAAARGPAARAGAHDQHVPARRALTDPALDPPVKALVCWNSNPAAIAPDQERVLEGLRRDDLFTVVLEQFMTDTAAHADVVLPATTQLEHLDVVFSWGHHYLTWNEPAIEPLGEAKPNTEAFRLIAARLGLDDPCFRESDEELIDALLRATSTAAASTAARARLAQDRPRPGADRRTPRAASAPRPGKLALHADYEPPAEVADAPLAERFPLAMITPKTHLFLNSTFANQRAPALGSAGAGGGAAPRRRGRARGRGRRRGARVQRPRRLRLRRAACPTTPARACWWRRWAGGTRTTRAGAAARPPPRRRSPRLGHAPTFNDNRVEVEALSRSARSPRLALEHAQHRLVQARARDPAAAHRAQHRRVGGPLVAVAVPRCTACPPRRAAPAPPPRAPSRTMLIAGSARSSVIATPAKPSSPRSRSVAI